MTTSPLRKRLLVVTGAIAVVLVIGGVAAWRYFRLSDLARIGAGYTAQQTCSCLFISRRPQAECQKDLDPLARKLVRVQATADAVTARAMGVARATARYQEGFGCSLLD